MSRFALIATVAVVLVQTVPDRASADIIQYESLDQAVMGSDLVIRGEVIEIVSKKGENGVVWNQVTIRVTETIKGEKFKELKFIVREAPFEPWGTAWRNLRDEMLLCLNAAGSNRGGFDKADFVLRGGWISWAVLLTGAPGTTLPIYSIDFKSLTDSKEILTAARAAAAAPAGKAKSMLEWIVQGPDTLMPHAVLYPGLRAGPRRRQEAAGRSAAAETVIGVFGQRFIAGPKRRIGTCPNSDHRSDAARR
jgi:hypothetical protein